jgi:hypothetical protein
MTTLIGKTKVAKARKARREWQLLQEQAAIDTKKKQKDSAKFLDESKNDKTVELDLRKKERREQSHLRVTA